ncbi:hypothetical protein BZA05DRAFT_445236 [Tricharina praecox]|uniref:uncharacterized protein n=1 Tax=Tricharina praecox TaxID=43433 RepID=UPI00221E8500|nr:uncharacterized protein BZA05DRAFT_445236 [Tricharina praecox]KAI5850856.1 hypothetical protein BZA05DRAFT_445236 [Tricharina praecox]
MDPDIFCTPYGVPPHPAGVGLFLPNPHQDQRPPPPPPPPSPPPPRFFHGLPNFTSTSTVQPVLSCGWNNCDQQFPTIAELNLHAKNSHARRIPPTDPTKSVSKTNTLACQWTSSTANCKRLCSKRSHLVEHMDVHVPWVRFACTFPHCYKSFARKSTWDKHKRSVHH